MANKPTRYHLFLPQGKSWGTKLEYPVGFDLTGYSHRLRIRSSFTKDKIITTNSLEKVDATVTVTGTTVALELSASTTTTLLGNCSYDEFPLTNELKIDFQALQSKSIAGLPGKPYVYEIEVENPSGNVDVMLFGGVLVPRETNRDILA